MFIFIFYIYLHMYHITYLDSKHTTLYNTHNVFLIGLHCNAASDLFSSSHCQIVLQVKHCLLPVGVWSIRSCNKHTHTTSVLIFSPWCSFWGPVLSNSSESIFHTVLWNMLWPLLSELLINNNTYDCEVIHCFRKWQMYSVWGCKAWFNIMALCLLTVLFMQHYPS